MLNNETHEKYMKEILINIFSDEIGQFLAFKGGTLAYRRYDLNRFSTDIDLDLLVLEREQEVVQKIQEILIKIGDIKNETQGKHMYRWIFRYDNEASMNIKVELNKRIWDNNTYQEQNIGEHNIMCMEPDSLFTNKLVALSERFYPRDLFDIHFFFQNKFAIKPELIKERTGLSPEIFFNNLKKELPKIFTEKTILVGLGEVLDNKQKNRVKTHLLQETLDQINNFLSSI